jgi:hypothetical protein
MCIMLSSIAFLKCTKLYAHFSKKKEAVLMEKICLAAFPRAKRISSTASWSSDLYEKRRHYCESQCLQYNPVRQEKKKCVAFIEYAKKRIPKRSFLKPIYVQCINSTLRNCKKHS